MKPRKICTSLLAVTMLTGLLAGCGGGEAKEPAASKDSSSSEVNTIDKAVELAFYQSSSGMTEQIFMEQYGNMIVKKFPNVTIKFYPAAKGTNIKELLTAGTPVDIVFDSIGLIYGSLMNNELQYDISPLIQKYKTDLNRFEPITVDTMKALADGGMYGLPVGNSTLAMYYNKDIFDKFGVAYPKDGMTWDEVYDVAKQMTRNVGGQQYRGFVSSPTHLLNMNQMGMNLYDPKTKKSTVGDDKWKMFLQNYLRFHEIPGNQLDSKTNRITQMAKMFQEEGTTAMFVYLSNNVPGTAINWDMVSMPTLKEYPGVGAQAYPAYFNITRNSEHKDEAFKVINYLTSDEFQMFASKEGRSSSLKSDAIKKAFGSNKDYYKGKHIEALTPKQYAKSTQATKYNNDIVAQLATVFYDITAGKKDNVNTALRDAEEAANKAIEQIDANSGTK